MTEQEKIEELSCVLADVADYINELWEVKEDYKHRAEVAEKTISNVLCADACYLCNEKYGECNIQHHAYGSKECVDRLLMLTKKDL